MSNIKKFICGFLAIVLLSVATLGVTASAQTTVSPAFNWYTDVSGVGDERDFLRIGPNAAEGVNTREVCEEGARLTFWFYVHNGAEEEFNGTNFDGAGVARNTRLNLSVPQNQAGNSHAITASISAANAPTVTDNVTVTCGSKKITLQYVGVTGFSTTATTNALGEYRLTGDPINGANVGYPGGVVPGCWDFRARLNFDVIVHVEQAPAPKPTPAPVLPKTGSGSVLSIFAGTTVIAALAHRYIFGRKYNG